LLKGDPVRIRQILYNLVGNAIKFTQQGSVRLHIYRLHPDENEPCNVHIVVSDSGPGFPDEMINHLFDSFTQADSALSRAHGGAGLGLSIVKRLIHLMGGSLAVDSQNGQGSDIHVTLKLKAATAENSALALQLPPEVLKAGEGGGVLVAEDDAISRLALHRTLEMAGFDVASVVDGRQALDAMKVRAYDVALLDVRMPEMDGTEVAQAYREWERANRIKKTRLIAVTAHAMAGDREQVLAQGMDDYITKPVELEDLVDKLRRILSTA
jgi:CheY-like chemotaxis protein